MVWLTLIVGIQLLGFAVTLTRLVYDAWQQRRLSGKAWQEKGPAGPERGSTMERQSDNVIAFQPAKPKRRFWHFRYPHEVVSDAALDMGEKRAILAAWASDVHAVESMPTLRHLPGTPAPVTFSAIMDARIALDRLTQAANDDDPPPSPANRRRQENMRAWKAA